MGAFIIAIYLTHFTLGIKKQRHCFPEVLIMRYLLHTSIRFPSVSPKLQALLIFKSACTVLLHVGPVSDLLYISSITP